MENTKTEIEVIASPKLSKPYDTRYVVIDKNTRQVLEDAQGYGFKSKQKAYACYAYVTRDKSKDKEKEAKKKHIQTWMQEHHEFMDTLETFAFEIMKGSWDPDDKVDAKFVKEMLDKHNLKPDFTAKELFWVWTKG